MNVKPVTIEMIKTVAKALGELNEKAVFVGGATVPFYLPEAYLSQARPTEDIDLVMEIIGREKNSLNEDVLRRKGFKHDLSEDAPICRWVYRDCKVDIMSTDISALGFTNSWYKEGVDAAIVVVEEPVKVKILSLPYFVATKIEAFKGRGNSDYQGSHDMEDIISVLEVAPSEMFEDVLIGCSDNLKNYLNEEFKQLQNNADFIDALAGAVFNRTNVITATQAVRNRIQSILDLN